MRARDAGWGGLAGARRVARSVGWLGALLLPTLAGCAGGPEPHGSGVYSPPTREEAAPTTVGASDTTGAAPGSAGAAFGFRFRQTNPASDRFTFYDRDLSFYFRPAPDALHFQIENKQDHSVWIDWERTRMLTPDGATSDVAHGTTQYRERFSVQSPTQIRGLQRFSDYVLPMDYLLDPGNSTDQLHRPLFPEDSSAPNYSGREFGVDFAMRVGEDTRTYSFRFKVVSVLPR